MEGRCCPGTTPLPLSFVAFISNLGKQWTLSHKHLATEHPRCVLESARSQRPETQKEPAGSGAVVEFPLMFLQLLMLKKSESGLPASGQGVERRAARRRWRRESGTCGLSPG